MDIIEAPSDVEDSEDSDQHPGKSHKKTNTPQVPSMILIPATSTIAPIRELPSLKHQSHCPMSVRSRQTLVIGIHIFILDHRILFVLQVKRDLLLKKIRRIEFPALFVRAKKRGKFKSSKF